MNTQRVRRTRAWEGTMHEQPRTSTTVDHLDAPVPSYREIVSLLTEGVLVRDRQGTILSANQMAADLFGLAVERCAGTHISTLDIEVLDVSGARLDLRRLPGHRCLQSGVVEQAGVVGVRVAGGRTAWVEAEAHPLMLDGDDRPAGVIITMRDVTERVRAEQAVAIASRRQEFVLSNSADGYRIFDADGRVIDAHPPVTQSSGFYGRDARSFGWLEPDDLARTNALFDLVLTEPGRSESADVLVRTPDNGDRWFEINLTNYLHEPTVGGVVLNYRDISERIAAEESVRFQARLLDTAGQAIIAADTRGRVLFWNRAAADLYGWSAEEAVGAPLWRLIHTDDRTSEELAAAISGGTPWSGDLELRGRDGMPNPTFLSITPVFDDDGGLVAAVGVSTDISERKRTEAELEYHAAHDPLTSLPNRLLLATYLDRSLSDAQRIGGGVAVLFVDIDNFKVINDGIGHATGDQVLRAAAERLSMAFPGQFVARFGGDEFVVVDVGARNVVGHAAAAIAEQVFVEPFRIDGAPLHLTASIGVAIAAAGDTSDTLLRDADAAMYQAKADGRARSHVFDQVLRSRTSGRLDVELSLRRAIERDELSVHYQPILGLDDGTIHGFEALVRWRHPDVGMIGPDRFIPVAEETGLILPIGAFVLDRALAQLAEWHRERGRSDLTMSVNLAPRQILDPKLAATVAAGCERYGIAPDRLMLEITESSLMRDVDRSIEVLATLQDLGVRLAVDDFGTGYSSLLYLKRFTVDVLKIDRSFVAGLPDDLDDAAIVRAVVSLGDALDLQVIAEGVETTVQRDILADLGCACAQGYLWSPAVPPEEMRWR